MNNSNKKHIKIFLIIISLLNLPLIIAFPIKSNDDLWDYSMRTKFPRDFDLFKNFNATPGFRERQSIYLNSSKYSDGLNAQSARIHLGLEVNEDSIESDFERLFDIEGMNDFTWASYVRLLYLDINKSLINENQKEKIIDGFGRSKFWFTESTETNTDIVYTENHQILCHTAEYLIGQLFPNDTFTYSKMTGKEHVAHAKNLLLKWLDWRGQFGFSEWNSNTYLNPDITSLVNLVDFAMDEEIVYKAAMVLDLIAFSFANNFYKNRFATSMGRCYDSSRAYSSRDSISEAAWIMLGIGKHNPCDNNGRAGVALATTKYYAPPPILEEIAQNASKYFEHKERQGIYLDEGDKYDISYEEEDMMLWWGMSAPMAPETIEESFMMLEKYNIEPMTLLGPQILVDYIKLLSFLKGQSLSETSKELKLITKGVCLEAANVYTYRTPDYQLSGAQDHMKGMDGMQEHIWQASLDDTAYVFTNSPGGVTKNFDQLFMGGWKPRGTFFKNVGIIQYDRTTSRLEAELLIALINLFTNNRAINHAYFPREAFDEVQQKDGWTFGKKDNSYIALYSYEPAFWASEYELRVNGFKNAWIVELGSKEESGSFEDFVSEIKSASLEIESLKLGYDISYKSPSQGKIAVAWEGPMKVKGEEVDLGDYPRFDNPYCSQEFGTKKTVIEFEAQLLELNFNNASRVYQDLS